MPVQLYPWTEVQILTSAHVGYVKYILPRCRGPAAKLMHMLPRVTIIISQGHANLSS